MPLFQSRDPLVGIFDYVVEVRLLGSIRSSSFVTVLNGHRKKCLEDLDDTDEDDINKDDMAITYHDDLRLIKDVVCPSQSAGLIPESQLVMHVLRRS